MNLKIPRLLPSLNGQPAGPALPPARASSLLKYQRNAVGGHTAYMIFKEITDSVGPVPSPGEFFNRLPGPV
jgi:hypothetical protein